MTDRAKKRAQDAADRYAKKMGSSGASIGRFNRPLDVYSTGILALDYALGTGGWPYGHPVEVFGPPDIGKSSIIGFNAIKSVQAQGKVAAIVALEPGFDPQWAEKNGVDLDTLVIGWPDDGQEAFDLAHRFILDPDIDFVLFDSIGAILRPSEADVDGKPSQGGQSALITWGAKRLLMPTWKMNKGLMFINQVRDKMGAHIPLLDSPGGHALKHTCAVRVQLKPGKERYTTKVSGEDVIYGRSIVSHILRNKLSEGTGHKATFDHYSMTVDDQPLGVDVAADVINTGMRTGVIAKGGAWYKHPTFPEGKLMGKDAVGEFLLDDDVAREQIRQEVLKHMKKVVTTKEKGKANG